MPSKSKLSEYTYSARAEYDRCQACFRSAQSLLLITLIFVFMLFILILGLDISKAQTDSGLVLGIIISLDLLAMIALGLGVRGVALEKCLLVVLFLLMFIVLDIAHSILFTCRFRGLSIFTLIIDVFVTFAGVVFLGIFGWFNKLKPDDYRELRLEARARALNGPQEEDEKDELP